MSFVYMMQINGKQVFKKVIAELILGRFTFQIQGDKVFLRVHFDDIWLKFAAQLLFSNL